MKETVGIISTILVFVAYIPYIQDIIAKRTIPHPYSWLVWGITALLIAALSYTYGGEFGVLPTVTVALMCFVVSFLAFRHGGRKTIQRHDALYLVVCLIAVIMWLFVQQPLISVVLLIGIDMLALIPSIRKAWKKPYSETLSLWKLNSLRQALTIVALGEYNLITILGPATWAIANLAFALMLISRRRVIARPRGKQWV